jgi:outer membrane lipopolysaccharide assembly protein LptE/RlpB
LQVEKENAIVATDFEKAAQCRDMQAEVRRRLILLLEELSRNQWTPFSTPFFLSTLAATWGA